MKCLLVFLLSLLCSLMEVHSQTEYPYISFMGVNLSNHAYVDLTTMGNDISDTGNTMICHTDLNTCCISSQGIHCGSWYFPNGTELQTQNPNDDIIIKWEPQSVHIRCRNNPTSPSGIYQGEIETVAVNDIDVNNIKGETVYVGLYPPNEGNQ